MASQRIAPWNTGFLEESGKHQKQDLLDFLPSSVIRYCSSPTPAKDHRNLNLSLPKVGPRSLSPKQAIKLQKLILWPLFSAKDAHIIGVLPYTSN